MVPFCRTLLCLARQLLPRTLAHCSISCAPDPQLIGRLESPEINLSVMVREGVDDDTLLRAAGHLPSSALPGQAGNFVVLAHRDTFFRALRGITRGASLKVRTRTGQFTYIVDSVQVTEPDSIRLEQGPEPSATLITCFPFTYMGRRRAAWSFTHALHLSTNA